MTKTENFSLNQWEPTDKLSRADFNSDNAAVDTALGQLWNGLLQTGELHLKQKYAAMDETALTMEPNLLLNPLSGAEMAESLTGAEWDAEQKVHIGRAPEVERTYLRDYSSNWTRITADTKYKSGTALYEFTAPKNGNILDFDLRYYMFFSSSYPSFTDGRFTFTAYENQDGTYVPVYEKSDITLELSGTASIQSAVTIPVELSIKEGYAYRLSLHMDSGQGVLGQIGFSIDTSKDNSQFTVQLDAVTEGSHSRTLTTREDTVRAVVLMEFQQEEDTDGITVVLDGAKLDEVERVTVQGDDKATHTVTCIGRGTVGKTHTLMFRLDCSETDRVYLNKYGIYLL